MRYNELNNRQQAIVNIMNFLAERWHDVELAGQKVANAQGIIDNNEGLDVNCVGVLTYYKANQHLADLAYQRYLDGLLPVLYELDNVGQASAGYADYLARYYTRGYEPFDFSPLTYKDYLALLDEYKLLKTVQEWRDTEFKRASELDAELVN